MTMRLLILISAVTLLGCWASAEVDIISEPQPGQEYVFVKASGSGARPITRKEKSTDASNRPFETAHKLPIALTFLREEAQRAEGKVKEKREAAAPIPAPPGSIKIDPKKLIEKYRSVLEASTKTPTTRTTTKKTRTKKEAPTTPNSVLTTGAPSTPRTLHIQDGSAAPAKTAELAASASDNKRSRIQIKKGPNGQEYEYEYVYYYYDDDDEEGGTGKGKISNSHDGPARNHISNGRGRHSTTTVHPEPAANEVVPSTRGTRQRGRQLNHDLPEEKVAEERLPQNTRFPPRSRNINTTPAPVEEEVETKRPRIRNRPQGQATDNAADETQVSGRGGGRNRANVRRPSLELVDSASFNTHSSNDPSIGPYKEPKARGEVNVKDSSAGPTFPSELPEGPVRFLGATPNEKMDLQDLKSRLSEDGDTSTVTVAESDNTVTTEEVATTETNAMDKVALDLYAILQGTQKLSGEDENSTDDSDVTTTELADTTDETTTEVVTTEEITTPTTTTTTTPAPTTTTTTPEPVTGRGRFRGRPGPGGNRFKASASTTTAAPEPSTEKAKSRFNRPSSFGGRSRPGQRTTTESSASSASEPEVTKEETKPVSSNSRPAIGARNRFSGRTRPPSTTTISPDSELTTPSSKSGLTRPRPGFALRRRGGASTTKEPTEEEESAAPTIEDTPSTTAKPVRGRVNGNLARPLRPGPRIGNLAGRGRLGAATTTTTAAPDAGSEAEAPSEETEVEGEEKAGETTPQPASQSPLNKLRNRPKININPANRPKTAASAPVQVRRTNPLLARRKPVTPEPSEASPTDPPQEASATESEAEEDAPSEATSSTTEEPRGLNKLLAGRRRLVGRTSPVNH